MFDQSSNSQILKPATQQSESNYHCSVNEIQSKLEGCTLCNDFDQLESCNKIVCLCQFHYKGASNRKHSSMLLDNPGKIYNYLNKCRKWVKVWKPNNLALKGTEFTVTTYNILSQNLLLNHMYLYQGNNKSNLSWTERSERIKQELIDLNSDIFCLQEVHIENFTTSILPTLVERGYQAVFKQKTGSNMDGCSIIFKKNKFQLQDSLEVQMNRKDLSHLLDRDQVALIVKLRSLEKTDRNLIIANTHLLFNPKRGDIKVSQLRLLLAELERFSINKAESCQKNGSSSKLKYHPIILCGDFNSEPSSPLVQFIEKGSINLCNIKSGDISGQSEGIRKGRYFSTRDLMIKGINRKSCYQIGKIEVSENDINDKMIIEHAFNFKSVYPQIDEFNKKLISISTCEECGLVDHIFYSYKHANLRLTAFKQLINKQILEKIQYLPNSLLGSDHISLSAKFYIF